MHAKQGKESDADVIQEKCERRVAARPSGPCKRWSTKSPGVEMEEKKDRTIMSGISASRIIISVGQHPKMKRYVRTGFFIISGDDEEFDDSKGYFYSCDQVLGGVLHSSETYWHWQRNWGAFCRWVGL